MKHGRRNEPCITVARSIRHSPGKVLLQFTLSLHVHVCMCMNMEGMLRLQLVSVECHAALTEFDMHASALNMTTAGAPPCACGMHLHRT